MANDTEESLKAALQIAALRIAHGYGDVEEYERIAAELENLRASKNAYKLVSVDEDGMCTYRL